MPDQMPPPGWDRRDPQEWAHPRSATVPAPRKQHPILKILGVLGALFVLVIVVALACAPVSAPRVENSPTSPIPTGDSSNVGAVDDSATISVEGSGAATVIYGNETGGTTQETVTLPWRKTLPDEWFLTVTGTSSSQRSTEITCTITRENRDPVVSRSSGPFANCTAAG